MNKLVANILIAIGIIILIRAVVDFNTNGVNNTATQPTSPESPNPTPANPNPLFPFGGNSSNRPAATPSPKSSPASDKSVPALW